MAVRVEIQPDIKKHQGKDQKRSVIIRDRLRKAREQRKKQHEKIQTRRYVAKGAETVDLIVSSSVYVEDNEGVQRTEVIAETSKTNSYQTEFSENKIVDMYSHSAEFRDIAESGKYIYVARRLVLYHSNYIQCGKNIGPIILSEKVITNPIRYCLAVKKEDEGATVFYHPQQHVKLRKGYFSSDIFTEKISTFYVRDSRDGGGDSTADTDSYGFEVGKSEGSGKTAGLTSSSFGSNPPDNNLLRYIIQEQLKYQQMSVNKLAEYLMISPETISRFWTRPKSRPELSNVIAVCIGLHMAPPMSDQVIHLSGYCLRNIPMENAYRALINIYYTQEIQTCNNMLIQAGFDPLTPAI